MSPDKSKKIILGSIIGMVLLTVAGDAVDGKWPKPAKFLAVGFISLLLVGGSELAPGLAAALAMVAVVGVALERLGPVASRIAGVVGGSVPLGTLSPAITDTTADGGIGTVSTTERPSPGRPAPGSPHTTPMGEHIVRTARRYLGVPYVWGGDSPTGFDCSGFTKWCYARNGITIPRVAAAQYAASRHVSTPNVGDLVFFGTVSNVHHVGIVSGNGKMIDAPHRLTVVQEQTYSDRTDVVGFGRFI